MPLTPTPHPTTTRPCPATRSDYYRSPSTVRTALGTTNHRPVNVVSSIELMEPNEMGHTTAPFFLVTLTRRLTSTAPLSPVCTLSRNGGECFVHGKAEDWKETVAPASDKREAERLINANCYSAAGIRCTLSAVTTEPIGVRLTILKMLLAGFWASEATHD